MVRKTSIKRGARVIVAIGVVLWGSATCGQYSSRGSTKSLTSFCGFKAGELRKSGKSGDQQRIEVRPKTQFRKFNKVVLVYSDSGRLSEVQAQANVRSMKAAAAKKEFEECIKWFRQAGMSKEPGDPDEEWSDDNARDGLGCVWRGRGAVKTKEAHLEARVEVCAQYRDPAMYKGDKSGQATGWILSICVNWSNVDDRDLVPGAAPRRASQNASEKTLDRPLVSGTTPKRTSQKTPLKTFVEQTFRTSFQSACPVEAYDMIMAYKPQWRKWDKDEMELLRNRPTRLLGRVGDEDADFARFLGITLNQTPSGVPRHPYIDVISPRGRTTLPGVRFAYGRWLARAVCGCECVMYAYSNPKDKSGAKESVGGAEALCLCALVLWGYDEDVKDGDKAAAVFGRRVESWLGINFAETNVTEKAKVTTTVSTFREGDLTVTATACAETIDTRYFVDKRGREIKGAKLREFNLEFQNKVTAKMLGAPSALSNEEREAMQKNLEKKLFDSHGIKEVFRKTVPMKYHVVISSGMPPPLSGHGNGAARPTALPGGGRLTYSRFANIICGMIKGQDIVVLAALMDKKVQKLSYAGLSDVVCLSVAETHAAVKRLQEATLLNGERSPVRRNVSEFLVHGVRYAFPMRASGRLAKGMPTAYAAPVAADEFATSGMVPVWTGSRGDVQGQAFDPLYPTAPEAAAGNETLYGRLALIDMLRGGRIRERRFAEKKIGEML